MKILVTGFTPFENRTTNASWVAACSLDDVVRVEIPVIWGQPAYLLPPLVAQYQPEIIISMGEGREGFFDIETLARNKRKQKRDNKGELPSGPVIEGGQDQLAATIQAARLHAVLAAEQLPMRISQDAGGFICEETLYVLETIKMQHASLKTVVFVHLPPYGTSLTFRQETRICDKTLLSEFAGALLAHVKNISRQGRLLAG